MGMDTGAKKLLETVTIETLHAHQFSRSSLQATQVLTDLLSRYLTLLSSTCAKYAEHAGRLRMTTGDAINALGELGVDMDELSEYCVAEGRELSRYGVHTARRVEDMNEFHGASRPRLTAGIMVELATQPISWWVSEKTKRTRFTYNTCHCQSTSQWRVWTTLKMKMMWTWEAQKRMRMKSRIHYKKRRIWRCQSTQ